MSVYYFIQIYIALSLSIYGGKVQVSVILLLSMIFLTWKVLVNLQKYPLLKYSNSFQSLGIFRALSISLDAGNSLPLRCTIFTYGGA